MAVFRQSEQVLAIASPSLGHVVDTQLSIGNVVSGVSRNTATFVTSMVAKLVAECDCLFLGEDSATNTLIEGAETSKDKRNTSDVFPVGPVSLFASRNSIPYIFQISIRQVSDAADTTGRTSTAVNAQTTLGYLQFIGADALREARWSWSWTALFGIGNGVDSQLAILHVPAIEGNAAAKLAAVIEDLLEEYLGLSNRKRPASSLLVEQTDAWFADVVDFDTGDMLSLGKGLAWIDGSKLAGHLGDGTFVTNAKTTGSAIDAQSFREADCRSKSEKSILERDEKVVEV
ncbi:hypothetical protein ACHAPU_011338 [Fusarium lateritium]